MTTADKLLAEMFETINTTRVPVSRKHHTNRACPPQGFSETLLSPFVREHIDSNSLEFLDFENCSWFVMNSRANQANYSGMFNGSVVINANI